MAEDSQGTNTPVQVTQDPAMPTGEQQVPEQEIETEAQPTSQSQEEGLPDGVSERTSKEFEKLRNELRQEREARKRAEQSFRSFQPQPVPTFEPVRDPYTGEVDERLTKLSQEAWEAKQQAAQAKDAIANFYAEQERREAILEVGPELDSESDKFDEELHELTSTLIQRSIVYPERYGNKQLTYKEAAIKAKDLLGGKKTNVEQIKKQAAVEAIEKLSPKEQASLEAVGNPSRVANVANEDQEDLVRRTRSGDLNAIVARLKKIDQVGKG